MDRGWSFDAKCTWTTAAHLFPNSRFLVIFSADRHRMQNKRESAGLLSVLGAFKRRSFGQCPFLLREHFWPSRFGAFCQQTRKIFVFFACTHCRRGKNTFCNPFYRYIHVPINLIHIPQLYYTICFMWLRTRSITKTLNHLCHPSWRKT